MKRKPFFSLILSFMLIVLMTGLVSCDLFDDDDDDNDTIVGDDDDDDVVTIDTTLIGIWYSATPFSKNYTDKLILNEYGEGTHYATVYWSDSESGYDGVSFKEESILWSVDESSLSVMSTDSVQQITGTYRFENQDNFLLIEYLEGHTFLFVRSYDFCDPNLIGEWNCESVEIYPPVEEVYDFTNLTFFENGNLSGEDNNYHWYSCDSIVVFWNRLDPNYSLRVAEFSFSGNQDTLFFDFSRVSEQYPSMSIKRSGIFTRIENQE